MDCSQPGSSVRGILQGRILEWVAIPSSRGSFSSRDWTWGSWIAGRFFTLCATREAAGAWVFNKTTVAVTVDFSQRPCSICSSQEGQRPLEEKETDGGTWEENMSKCQHWGKTSRNGSAGGNMIYWGFYQVINLKGRRWRRYRLRLAVDPAAAAPSPRELLSFQSSSLLPMQRAACALMRLYLPLASSFATPSPRSARVPHSPTQSLPGPYCLPLVSCSQVDTGTLSLPANSAFSWFTG